jgi:hypothetical protein
MPVIRYYEGGPLGVHALTEALEAEGVEVRYTAPIEERGAGRVAVEVLFHIGRELSENAEDAAYTAALIAAARRAIAKVRERLPIKAEIEDD